jgi:hypothetical protein
MKQSTGKISNWRELVPLLQEDRHSEEEVRLSPGARKEVIFEELETQKAVLRPISHH